MIRYICNKLSEKLGCEVVEISALKGTGISKAAEKAVALAQKKTANARVHEFDAVVEKAVEDVENRLDSGVPQEQKRFFAIKLLEKDDKIQEQMKVVPDVSDIIKQLEDSLDDDTESIITNERYVYISSIIGDCCTKNKKSELSVSDKIDRIVTNRWAALPIFAAVMFVVILLYPLQQSEHFLPTGPMIHSLVSGSFRVLQGRIREYSTVQTGLQA